METFHIWLSSNALMDIYTANNPINYTNMFIVPSFTGRIFLAIKIFNVHDTENMSVLMELLEIYTSKADIITNLISS